MLRASPSLRPDGSVSLCKLSLNRTLHALAYTSYLEASHRCKLGCKLAQPGTDHATTMDDPERTAPTQAQLDASGRGLTDQRVFETAMHKTRMAMSLADPNLPDCPLVYVNPSFIEMTGYGLEAALGRNCRFLQGPETDRDAVKRIHQAVEEREPIDVEIYNYQRDGSGFWNALYVSPVFDDGGKLTYFFASQIDISARKEAARRQAQRMASMDALASGVAHEFNNLMTVVLGSLDRVSSRSGLDDGQRRHLEHAEWGTRRAGQLAGELLRLAQHQATEDRTVDLIQIVRSFEGTLAQIVPQGVQVRFDLAPAPVLVHLDPGQLERVLLDLVRNAADAMPGGGRMEVITRVLPAPEAASALNGREAVELVVTDTGQGMPPEILGRATELFFTTKVADNKGAGLGLFLALEFVDRSGGRLTIDSQAGQGTRVRLVFPRVARGR